MIGDGLIAHEILSPLATATLLVVMFHLGTLLTVDDYRAAWRDPWLMSRAIFCSVIAVPVIVAAVARGAGLPRLAQIGMVLAAICPGAPLAARRALTSGGDARFSLALQATVAMLCVVTIPIWVAGFDEVFASHASIEPAQLAIQVLVAQLLPLGLGVAARSLRPAIIVAVERRMQTLSNALVAILVVLLVIDVWGPVYGLGLHVAITIVAATLCAMALGHLLGGPAPAHRTTLAIASGARNAGLALTVAVVNHAHRDVTVTVLAYVLIAALTATPYAIWRRQAVRK